MRAVTPEKLRMYALGLYICQVPPVPTNLWSDTAWVIWIDNHGRWLPPKD